MSVLYTKMRSKQISIITWLDIGRSIHLVDSNLFVAIYIALKIITFNLLHTEGKQNLCNIRHIKDGEYSNLWFLESSGFTVFGIERIRKISQVLK